MNLFKRFVKGQMDIESYLGGPTKPQKRDASLHEVAQGEPPIFYIYTAKNVLEEFVNWEHKSYGSLNDYEERFDFERNHDGTVDLIVTKKEYVGESFLDEYKFELTAINVFAPGCIQDSDVEVF